jgi:hypothetical protein
MGEIFTNEDQHAAMGQGWGLFCVNSSETPVQLQRCDETERFTCDADAWRFVAKMAFAGCQVARRALATLRNESTQEWEAVRLITDGLYVR